MKKRLPELENALTLLSRHDGWLNAREIPEAVRDLLPPTVVEQSRGLFRLRRDAYVPVLRPDGLGEPCTVAEAAYEVRSGAGEWRADGLSPYPVLFLKQARYRVLRLHVFRSRKEVRVHRSDCTYVRSIQGIQTPDHFLQIEAEDCNNVHVVARSPVELFGAFMATLARFRAGTRKKLNVRWAVCCANRLPIPIHAKLEDLELWQQEWVRFCEGKLVKPYPPYITRWFVECEPREFDVVLGDYRYDYEAVEAEVRRLIREKKYTRVEEIYPAVVEKFPLVSRQFVKYAMYRARLDGLLPSPAEIHFKVVQEWLPWNWQVFYKENTNKEGV